MEDADHLSGIIAISAGSGHAMALEKYEPSKGYYGRVFTWGTNKYCVAFPLSGFDYETDWQRCSVLGNGNTEIENSPEPVIVCAGQQCIENPIGEQLKNIISIAAGAKHCMAIDKEGNVWTWGVNECGQLGTGDRVSYALPQRISFNHKIFNVTQKKWYLEEIQNAIDEAQSGDEIVVYPGQYVETVTIPFDKSVSIHSVAPYDWSVVNKTTIDGTNVLLASGQALVNINAPNAEFRGFTIQHSSEHGITITDAGGQTSGDNVRIANCVISDNKKNGINIVSPYVEIVNSFILRNGDLSDYSNYDGTEPFNDLYHGVYLTGNGTRTIVNNTIVLNHGFGICGPANVDNCIVWNNILPAQFYACSSIQNCISVDDPGLLNAPFAVDRSKAWGFESYGDRLFAADPSRYQAGSIIEYTNDGIPRVVITKLGSSNEYVVFSPSLPSGQATAGHKSIKLWYNSLDSVTGPGVTVLTSTNGNDYDGNGNDYDGNENRFEVDASDLELFEIGDIIRYQEQYREIVSIDETANLLLTCDSGRGVPLSAPSIAGNNIYSYGKPTEWRISLEENYHLRYSESSSSIDRASSLTGITGEIDIDGHPRLVGNCVDIGADEYTALKTEAGENKQIRMPLDTSVASVHLSEAYVHWGDFENDNYPQSDITTEWSIVSKPSGANTQFSGLTEFPQNEIHPTLTCTHVGFYLLQLTVKNGETVIGGDRIEIEVLPAVDAGGPYEIELNDDGGFASNITLEGSVYGLAEGGYTVNWISSSGYIDVGNAASLTEAYLCSGQNPFNSFMKPGLYAVRLEIEDPVTQMILGSDVAVVICNDRGSNVNAGNDQVVNISPANGHAVVSLAGSVSGRNASNFQWELVSGPEASVNFETDDTNLCTLVALSTPGTYEFAFHAYEGSNEIGVGIISVVVNFESVLINAGQDEFINAMPYIVNLEGSIKAQDSASYSTYWFCPSNDVQFGNPTHSRTWVRFTKDSPDPGVYTCVLVAYDPDNNIVAADSMTITVDGGQSSIPPAVISAGGDYGTFSAGAQVPIMGQILGGTPVSATLWVGSSMVFNDRAQLQTTAMCLNKGPQIFSLLAFNQSGNLIGADCASLTISDIAIDAKVASLMQGPPAKQLEIVADSFGPYYFVLNGFIDIDRDGNQDAQYPTGIHVDWLYEGPAETVEFYEPTGSNINVSIAAIGRYVFTLRVMSGESVIAYDSAIVDISLSGFYIDIPGSDRYHCWKGPAWALGGDSQTINVYSFGKIPSQSSYYEWTFDSELVELVEESADGTRIKVGFDGLGDFHITCTLYSESGIFLAEDTIVVHVFYGFEVNAGRDQAIKLVDGTASVSLDDAFITLLNSSNADSFELMVNDFDWVIPTGTEDIIQLIYHENDVDSKLHPMVHINSTGIYALRLSYYSGATVIDDLVRIWVCPEEEPVMVNAGDDCTVSSLTNSTELDQAWVLPPDTSVIWSVQAYPSSYPANGPRVTFEPSENVINPIVYFPAKGTYTLRVQAAGQTDVHDDITLTVKAWEISNDVTLPAVQLGATYNSTSVNGQENVNGLIRITASGSDEVGGSGMRMLELVLLGQAGQRTQLDSLDEASPTWQITYDLNTFNIPNGAHTLIAYARDQAGNIGVSSAISFGSTTNGAGQNPISDFHVNRPYASDINPSLTFIASLETSLSWALYFDSEAEPRRSGTGQQISESVNVIDLGEGIHEAKLKVQVGMTEYQATVEFSICSEEALQAELSALINAAGTETIALSQNSDLEALNQNIVNGTPLPILSGSKYHLLGTAYHSTLYNNISYQIVIYDNDYKNYTNVTPNPSLSGYRNAFVQNDILADLDLSNLPNGVYNLELNVRFEGISSSTKTQFILDCPLKIGNVKFAQQDLSIPIAGIPLQVVRSYDSFQRETLGDFGFGWSYALTSLDIQLNEPAATEDGSSSDYFDRDVTLTLPSGQRTTFTFELESCSGPGIKNWKGLYSKPEGVAESFRTKDPEILVYGGGFYGVDYFWQGHEPGVLADGESVNLGLQDFSGFVLSSPDGTEYNIERLGGNEITVTSSLTDQVIYTYNSYAKPYLESIYLSSGETVKFVLATTSTPEKPVVKEVLCFSAEVNRLNLPVPIWENDSSIENLRNTSMKSIEIIRDLADRIIAINAPSENGQPFNGTPTAKYDYDDDGNLEAVHILRNKLTGEYDTTSYLYEDHYVTDIKDPRGLSPIRYLYDNQGRLTGTMDAKGEVIHIEHDAGGRTETVTDRLGNESIYQYNDRGNVVTVTNAQGETFYQYGMVTVTYNDGQQEYTIGTLVNSYLDSPSMVRDPAGNKNYYLYDSLGRPTKTIDAELNITENVYEGDNLKRSTQSYIPDPAQPANRVFVSRTVNTYSNNLLQMAETYGDEEETNCISQTVNHYLPNNQLDYVETYDPMGQLPTVKTHYRYQAQSNSPDQPYAVSKPFTGDVASLSDDDYSSYSYYDENNRQVASWTYGDSDSNGTVDQRTILVSEYDAQGRTIRTIRVVDSNVNTSEPEIAAVLTNLSTSIRNGSATVLSETSYNKIGKIDYTLDYKQRINGETTYEYLGGIAVYDYDELGNTVETWTGTFAKTFDNSTGDLVGSMQTQLFTLSQTLYDVEGRTIVSVGPYVPGEDQPTGTETVYDALGRIIEMRLWANVHIMYEDLLDTQGNVVGRKIVQGKVAEHASAAIPSNLAWTSNDRVPVIASQYNTATQIGPKSYTRTIYDNAGRVKHSISVPAQAFDSGLGADGGWRYDEQITTVYYDKAGKQIQVVDPQGHKNLNAFSTETIALYGYTTDVPVIAKRRNYSTFVDSTEAGGNLTGTYITETAYEGSRRSYVVDARGFEAEADPADYMTSFIYDALGHAITTEFPPADIDGIDQESDGNKEDDVTYSHVGYDGLGRKEWDTAQVLVSRDDLDAMDATECDQFLNNHAKRYVYDVAGRLTQVILPIPEEGMTNPIYDYLYDCTGNMIGILEPKHRLTVFKFDHFGRQTHKFMPFEITPEQYNAFMAGTATVYELLDAESPAPAYEQTWYNEFGHIDKIKDYKGQYTVYTYYTAANMWSSDPNPIFQGLLGQLQFKSYYDGDPAATGVLRSYINFTYDKLGRKATETFVEDCGGPQESTRDWSYDYDMDGRLEKIESPQGQLGYAYNAVTGQKQYTYTGIGGLSSPDTLIRYGYGEIGRLGTVGTMYRNGSPVVGELTEYDYNVVGSRASMTLPNDIYTWYNYNALNRLTSLKHFNQYVDDPRTNTVNRVSTYDYGLKANGMRSGVNEYLKYPSGGTDESPALDYAYDNLNRLTDETNRSSTNGYEAHYIYDLAGNRLSRSVTANGQSLNTTYIYDVNTDRLLRETHDDPFVAIPYGDNQRIYAYAGTGSSGITYQLPNSDSRIGQLRAFLLGLPSMWNTAIFYLLMVLIPVAFLWPVFVRRWSRIKGSVDPMASPDLKLWHRMLCVLLSYIFLVGPEAFQYFAQAATQYGQISTAAWGNDGDVFTYFYDQNGSQVYKVYDGTISETLTPDQVTTWLSNNPTIDYDRSDYNLQNQLAILTKVRHNEEYYPGQGADDTVQTVVEYNYDPAGIRVSAEATVTVNGTSLEEETSIGYLMDPDNQTGYAQVLEETTDRHFLDRYDEDSDGNTTEYLTRLTRIQYTIGDDIISQTTSHSTNGVTWTVEDINEDSVADTEYLLYDGHGSTRQLSRPDKSVFDSFSYDGYGVMLSNTSGADAASNAATSLLYCGEQYDSASDQYYLRARYYNPANGLFNRVDPYAGNMQDPQSLHKYIYCHNDPVNGLDPTGEMTLIGQVCVTAIMSALVSIGFDVAEMVLTGTQKSIGEILINAAISAVMGVLVGPLLGSKFGPALSKAAKLLQQFSKLKPMAQFLVRIASHPKYFKFALAFTRAFISTTATYFQSRYNGNSPTVDQLGLLFLLNFAAAFGFNELGSKEVIGKINDSGLELLSQHRGVMQKLWDTTFKSMGGDGPILLDKLDDVINRAMAANVWPELVGCAASSDTVVGTMITFMSSITKKLIAESSV